MKEDLFERMAEVVRPTPPQTKHIPGPWFVDGHNLRSVIVKGASEYDPSSGMKDAFDRICNCSTNTYLTSEFNMEADKANAKLIAAAPELLEALEDLMEAVPKQTEDMDWWEDNLTEAFSKAKAAIQKAEAL